MIALSHPISGTRGQATDIQINAVEVLAKRGLMLEILSQNTGRPIEQLTKDMDRSFYLTPQQAQEYGLIDRVIASTKEATAAIAV
jgi:ATP-dependent Clp protease protease subunit